MDGKPPYSEFALIGFILGLIGLFAIFGLILGMTNVFNIPVSILGGVWITLLRIIPALGIIFSLIGIFKTGKKKKRGMVLAVIGLVLSTIIFIFSIGIGYRIG